MAGWCTRNLWLEGTSDGSLAYIGDRARRTSHEHSPYPNAQAIFYQQYESVRRDEVVGILLRCFWHFRRSPLYLRRTGLGILYCCFFWTGITAILGFIECFFMPGRVREFNAIQAAGIAAMLGISMPGWGYPFNVTVNVPAAPQPGTLVACGAVGRPSRTVRVLLRVRCGDLNSKFRQSLIGLSTTGFAPGLNAALA